MAFVPNALFVTLIPFFVVTEIGGHHVGPGAIFLILELDQPFGGVIRISSEPMVNALNQLAK